MSIHQPDQNAGIYEHSGMQDPVSINIGNMLSAMPPISSKHSIFRVRHHLREVNKKAYDPEILAIGPYHHGNDKYKFMEEQKLRYLQQLLERRKEVSIDGCVATLRTLEKDLHDCYAETINSTEENFLAMMLIDGCFIIELFRKLLDEELIDKDDRVMHESGIRYSIMRDLLLLENQVPLDVLRKLHDLTKGPNEPRGFSDFAFYRFLFVPGGSCRIRTDRNKVEHLRHLSRMWRTIDKSQGEHILHLYHMWRTFDLPETDPQYRTNVMPSATELRESGVRFRALQGGQLSDIKFKHGTLEIPVFDVEDNTESHFRNLVAYEQHRQSRGINYFTDYVIFLDCLINSSKDVKMLRRAGILKNHLGDDEMVAQMFNKIGDHVIISGSFYSEIFENVNAYCDKPWNIQMAKLRREYFHSPWAFLSVLAAIVLLLLTIAQTVFSILSYKKQG